MCSSDLRDLSLTQAARLPESNKLTDGRWATGQDEVTVETKLAESLGLELGDSLTFTGPGPAINATVVGLREVDWESFAPNFYFIFSPDTLKAQSRTWITSFFLPQVQQAELGGLVQKFPQISLLDVMPSSPRSKTSLAKLAAPLLWWVCCCYWPHCWCLWPRCWR